MVAVRAKSKMSLMLDTAKVLKGISVRMETGGLMKRKVRLRMSVMKMKTKTRFVTFLIRPYMIFQMLIRTWG